MFPKPITSQRGFTMIELLTVLVILGVLITISLVAFTNAISKARLSRVKTNVSEIVLRLDDFANSHNDNYPALTVYHNTLPPSNSITTTPAPPPDPDPSSGNPVILKRMGNAIVGGSPGLVDTGYALQDDFYRDELVPPPDDINHTVSLFRNRSGEVNDPDDGPMRPVDQLVLNGHFSAYPANPLRGPGVPMVNIAYVLYDYDALTNDFQWVDITVNATGEVRTGLCAARPSPLGVYEPIVNIWDEDSYPQGDFAYIPFQFINQQGTLCKGYWIICYGDVSTLQNSEYNKFALDMYGNEIDPTYHNWPNLPPPYGDGNPNTPPVIGTVEWEIKRIIQGALDVRATVFDDQLKTTFIPTP